MAAAAANHGNGRRSCALVGDAATVVEAEGASAAAEDLRPLANAPSFVEFERATWFTLIAVELLSGTGAISAAVCARTNFSASGTNTGSGGSNWPKSGIAR